MRTQQLLADVSAGLHKLDDSAYTLSKTARALSFAQVAGKVEVAQLNEINSFPVILEQIKEGVAKTQGELSSLSRECVEASMVLSETVRDFGKLKAGSAVSASL